MKIFVSAYACEPYKGSEPGIGWSFIHEISKYHETHVLTRANNKELIDEALDSNHHENLCFHYYDVPRWLTFWKNKRRGYQLYYYLWQILAFFKFRKYINTNGFDIVHHLTFGADWMPSLFMKCRPFTVWGPVGSEDIPKSIYRSLSLKLKIKESVRTTIKWFFYHVEPFRKQTLKHADLVLCHSSHFSKYTYPDKYRHKVQNHIQTGLNTNEPEYQIINGFKENSSGTTRLIIASELVDWKGVTISAEVFSRIAAIRDDIELVILGEGPEKQKMKDIFIHYDVQSKVNFKGFVDKQQLIQELYVADILLYPAYHHGLATIILQSMYAYLPIVSLEGDIISDVVKDGCGVVANGESIDMCISDLVDKTNILIDSMEIRKELAESAHLEIKKKYEWQVLAKAMLNQYQRAESQSH